MAKVYSMTDLALDDEDIMDMECPLPIPMSDRAKYPYETRIALTEKIMERLNLDPEAAVVGGMVHLHAMARITSVSSNEQMDGGKCCRVELQLEAMALEDENLENKEYDAVDFKQKRREKMYGKV